jgi:hypothetical protein
MDALVGLEPLHEPLALQLLALVLDQFSVVVAPLDTEVGEALSVTVGAGAGAGAGTGVGVGAGAGAGAGGPCTDMSEPPPQAENSALEISAIQWRGSGDLVVTVIERQAIGRSLYLPNPIIDTALVPPSKSGARSKPYISDNRLPSDGGFV